MRIVIDMQGAQTGSRLRGIGKYSLSLVKTIARNSSTHEVWLVLNGAFSSTIEPIRGMFEGVIPQSRICVFETPLPARGMESQNVWRSQASELIREAAISDLNPDILLITSLFEGWDSDAVVSVKRYHSRLLTATILYDLIPFLYRAKYLESPFQEEWYFRKIEFLKKSDLLLSISEASREAAIEHLGVNPERIVNISGGVDQEVFSRHTYNEAPSLLLEKYGVLKKFLLYVPGGFDWRKNFKTLFEAFSLLPESLRDKYHLVIPGNIPPNVRGAFDNLLRVLNLREQVVFPGYVSEKDLSTFYSSCSLFVYPSLCEGLGFPVLEAMSSGAPVIASNTTSIPEIIQSPQALFDPNDADDIAKKIESALCDDTFRNDLLSNGRTQISRFSWEACANRALDAMSRLALANKDESRFATQAKKFGVFSERRLKILVLKLDHLGDLILAVPAMVKLKRRYPFSSLTAIVGSWNVDCAKMLGIFDKIHSFDFFHHQSSLGPNASPHHLNDLLKELEDYDIAIDLRRQRDTRYLMPKINARVKVGYQSHWADIDKCLDICLPVDIDISEQRLRQNMRPIGLQMMDLVDAIPDDVDDFLVFPKLSSVARKGLQVAIFPKAGNSAREWSLQNYVSVVSWLSNDSRVDRVNIYLSKVDERILDVFSQGDKVKFHLGLQFDKLCDSLSMNALALANNSGGAHLSSYLGLNLITIFSGHELPDEWAPSYGENTVISFDVPCSPCHLADSRDCVYGQVCLTQIAPETVIDELSKAIDRLAVVSAASPYVPLSVNSVESGGESWVEERSERDEIAPSNDGGRGDRRQGDEFKNHGRESLIRAIATIDSSPTEGDLISTARSISVNFPSKLKRELIVDVSELVMRDGGTGIHRVVRSILSLWVKKTVPGFDVMPVYCSHESTGSVYRYANSLRSSILGERNFHGVDDIVEPVAGDVFVGLDLSHHGVVGAGESGLLDRWRNRGVRINFVVYDILHILHPEWFKPNTLETIVSWMSTIVRVSDVLPCISKSVSDDVQEWIRSNSVARSRQLTVNHFRLSGDLGESTPTTGISESDAELLQKMQSSMVFLSVGTIEPRKGYVQLLSAFEILWKVNFDALLVIVGRKGWMMDEFIQKILRHPESGKRLFWLDNCSDECLEKMYRSSTCLIAPSEGEGFGLPLVEASRCGLPVIAREIPVFREVLKENAFFFSGNSPEDLFSSIVSWMGLFKKGQAPRPTAMPDWTWSQSAEQLLECIQL